MVRKHDHVNPRRDPTMVGLTASENKRGKIPAISTEEDLRPTELMERKRVLTISDRERLLAQENRFVRE